MYSTLLAFSLVMVYLTAMLIKNKRVPPSLSETYYLGGKWVFTLVLAVAGFLLAAGLISISSPDTQFLGFFSGAGLLFVAAAPQFKEDFVKSVHYAGAFTFGIASQLWVIFNGTPLTLAVWGALPFIWRLPTRTFWIEMICTASLIASVIIKNF